MLLAGGAALYLAWQATRPGEPDQAQRVDAEAGAAAFAAPVFEGTSAAGAASLGGTSTDHLNPAAAAGALGEAPPEAPGQPGDLPGSDAASGADGVEAVDIGLDPTADPTLPGTTDALTPRARITVQVYGTGQPRPRRPGGGSEPKRSKPPGSGTSERPR